MSKRRVGRPLKFATPQELHDKGMAYLKQCQETKAPITITGLAIHLDTSRETLMAYENRDEFYDVVKKLKDHCEGFAEHQLYSGRSPAGAIFALKNYGWTDRQEIDQTTTITENVNTSEVDLDLLADEVAKKLKSNKTQREISS